MYVIPFESIFVHLFFRFNNKSDIKKNRMPNKIISDSKTTKLHSGTSRKIIK